MPLLLTGASGRVGRYLLRALRESQIPTVAWSHAQQGDVFGMALTPIDLGHKDLVVKAFRAARPSTIIHAAAISTLAECQRHPDRAWSINRDATQTLVELAEEASCRFIHLSTDLVFDGERGGYKEEDVCSPTSLYGQTKAAAEDVVRSSPRGVVLRLSLLYGPSLGGHASFFDEQIAALRERRPCPLFIDEWRTPLDMVTASQGILDVCRSDYQGTLHLGGWERLSRFEMGQRLAAYLGADPSVFVPTLRSQIPSAQIRPRDLSLNSHRWQELLGGSRGVDWEEGLRRVFGAVSPLRPTI